jgi:hypothetical protein
MFFSPHPASSRRGVSRSSRTWEAGCDGCVGARDEALRCIRQNRVVLTPRRWRQVSLGFSREATVAKEPGHRGEREISRQTIAQGMPGATGVPVVSNSCAFYIAHEAAGASFARHSLRPPNLSRALLGKTRAKSCRGNANARLSSSSLRAKRSNPESFHGNSLDCFVASLLAMTGWRAGMPEKRPDAGADMRYSSARTTRPQGDHR